MLSHKIKKLPKSTIEIEVKIPWEQVKKEYDKAFEALLAGFEAPGFRKGKAPEEVAKKNIKKETAYGQMIRDFFPRVYKEIVDQEKLKPVINPKIELIKAKEDNEWQIKILVAERPTIKIGDYKNIVKKTREGEKKSDIWVPGKAPTQEALNKILDALMKDTKLEISDLIVDEELERRLAQLVDDVQKLGLTVESYLQSRGTNIEDLKKQYRKEIEDVYKLEFLLAEIADKENIIVEQNEFEKFFANIKDEKEKQTAMANSYFYANLLRKQKTLDFLIGL